MSRVCLTRHLEMLLSFVSLGFYIVSSQLLLFWTLLDVGLWEKAYYLCFQNSSYTVEIQNLLRVTPGYVQIMTLLSSFRSFMLFQV